MGFAVIMIAAIGRTATAQTTYTQVLDQIFQPRCLGCHSSNLVGAARNGAPVGVDYNTFANATSGTNETRANVRIQAGTMPPGGGLSGSLMTLMQAWANGGFDPNAAPIADAVPIRPSTKARWSRLTALVLQTLTAPSAPLRGRKPPVLW